MLKYELDVWGVLGSGVAGRNPIPLAVAAVAAGGTNAVATQVMKGGSVAKNVARRGGCSAGRVAGSYVRK